MKIYCISGLGADERMFQFLKLDCELITLNWIIPFKNENIEEYALRLSEKIDKKEPFGIMGLSFGGLIGVEISKKLEPAFTILISTVEKRSDLPLLSRVLGKTNIISIIPAKFLQPPHWLSKRMFGTENTELLFDELDNVDPMFNKWALVQLTKWNNTEILNNCFKIYGTSDKMLPATNGENVELIKGGEHFMIVDRANEISRLINDTLAKY